jgi:RTX calcium-binding nonapeptide repeat (4 copies)
MKVRTPSRPWFLLLIAVASFTALCSTAAAASVQEALLQAKPAVALVSAEVKAEAVVDYGRGLITIRPSPGRRPGQRHAAGGGGEQHPVRRRGDDTLTAGKGSSVLVGGPWSDRLWAGSGRDLLSGGGGADRFAGAGDDDILIAGRTRYDGDAAALRALMAEWMRTDVTYGARVEHLRGGGGRNGLARLDASAGADDEVKDDLAGGPGLDWFFAGADDAVTGRRAPEILTPESPGPVAIAWSAALGDPGASAGLRARFVRPSIPEFAIDDA